MKEKDYLFHEKKYSKDLENFFEFKNHPRNTIIDLFEKNFKPLSGKVLDIGAGDGYASIFLANNKNIDRVDSVEISKAACQLIDKKARYLALEKKLRVINSDIYDLDENTEYDYIISFGFLHHADCLFSFYNKISKILKNEGYLIAQEPVMPNNTKNIDYINKYNTKETKEGIEMFNYERDDHFFREAEYIVGASFNNFDLEYYEDFKLQKANLDKKIFPKIFFFQKNINQYTPHKWKML